MNQRTIAVVTATLGLVALAAVLSLSVACKNLSPTESPDQILPTATAARPAFRSIEITVRDAETALPVAKAQIKIGDRQGQSDDAGLYAASVSNGRAHPVEVQSPGYAQWQGHVDVTPPGTAPLTLDVALEPNTVQGQILGHNAIPLPNANVSAGTQQVQADDTGQFTLYRLQEGDMLAVDHPGYISGRMPYQGQSTLQVVLEPISVTVDIHDAITGLGIPGVSVCAHDDACWSTDDTGQTVLRPAVHGTSLTIQRPGYQPGDVVLDGQETLQVELAPRELTGTIRDAESGQPLTNTILFVNGQVVPLEEGGRYHLPDLTTVYTLFVKSPGYKRVTIPIDAETSTSRFDLLDACQDHEANGLPCADINLPRFAVYGLYANYGLLTWDNARLLELIDLVDRSPILNAIVIDVKGDYGYLAFESSNPLIAATDAMASPRLPLSEFLRICQEKHIYTIARMVIFKDSPLIKARPELAVRHPNGAIFYDREGMAWADPTRKEVWEYNIAITQEVIGMGFDEVQYDYLRYPSDSTSLEIVRALVYSVPSTLESRTAAIMGFVAEAKKAVDRTPAFLSADIFGYALSIDPEHDMRIGQRLKDIAPHVDYICPMVYPSTFIPGNLGLASPSDNPYEVVARSMAYGLSRTSVTMRPWLQGYWYERQDFAEQRRAAQEATDAGWCFWNARGIYDELFFIPPEGIEP
jgi:hypothetical protein